MTKNGEQSRTKKTLISFDEFYFYTRVDLNVNFTYALLLHLNIIKNIFADWNAKQRTDKR